MHFHIPHLHLHHDHSQHPEHSGNTALRDALILAHGCLDKLGGFVSLAPLIGDHLKSIFNAAASILENVEKHHVYEEDSWALQDRVKAILDITHDVLSDEKSHTVPHLEEHLKEFDTAICAINEFILKHNEQSWFVDILRSHHDHKELHNLEAGLDKAIHMFLVRSNVQLRRDVHDLEEKLDHDVHRVEDGVHKVIAAIDGLGKEMRAQNHPESSPTEQHELSPETMERLQKIANNFVSRLNKKAALARQEREGSYNLDSKYPLPSYAEAEQKLLNVDIKVC